MIHQIDARNSPPKGGAGAPEDPPLVSRIAEAFARGAAAGAAGFGTNARMQPMVQRLMWTRRVGKSELALIDVASRGKRTYQVFVVTGSVWALMGEFRRYADAAAAAERCIDDLARGDRPSAT